METIQQGLNLLITGVEYFWVVYFSISCLYVFLFSVGGHTYKKRNSSTKLQLSKIGVFIPAYKEDSVIVDVAHKALTQEYPRDMYDVIVIADSLQKKTLQKLKCIDINLVEVVFKNSTKSKALNAAMAKIEAKYDFIVILDADNVMESKFLLKINSAFQNGYRAVQGHRKAKNKNTPYAILDAASEEINNHIFRKGHRALGLSSGLIGSGMGFDYKIFKSIMKTNEAIGGFDKVLEFELAKRNIVIEYLQHAIVYDEKIQKSIDFVNQRRRWLATQIIYSKKYFKIGFKSLITHKNVTLFDKLFQMMIPTRVMLLGITWLTTILYIVINFVFEIETQVSSHYWVFNLVTINATLLLALPRSFYNVDTLKALAYIPSAFLKMMRLLFNLRGANESFIHTSHGVIKN